MLKQQQMTRKSSQIHSVRRWGVFRQFRFINWVDNVN